MSFLAIERTIFDALHGISVIDDDGSEMDSVGESHRYKVSKPSRTFKRVTGVMRGVSHGRRRHRACQLASVEPTFRTVTVADPVAYLRAFY